MSDIYRFIDETYTPGFSTAPPSTPSKVSEDPAIRKSGHRPSHGSSARLRRRQSETETSSLVSASTALSSAPPAWAPRRFDYLLRCEHEHLLDCPVIFHPWQWEDWVAHSVDHFQGHDLPPKSTCNFCDRVTFALPYNRVQAWRLRMAHMAAHVEEAAPEEAQPRVNHPLLRYMKECDLLLAPHADELLMFSERPGSLEHLVPRGFKTIEMLRKEHEQLRTIVVDQNERREMRKERRKERTHSERRK